ncbi:MAG: ABC transporter ATP-binding protein [Bacillota bacterium]|jgi:iron complex transport system ATP-binding protein
MTDTLKTGCAVEVVDLAFSYRSKGREKKVMDGVSLKIPTGTLTAIVGPNGSGKSTLLKAISGYLRPDSGRVLVDGRPVHELPAPKRSRLVSYFGDEPEPSFDFTVLEVVMMGRYASVGTGETQDMAAAYRAMEEADVMHLRGRPITQVSSGERQRVYLARAICQDSSVFLLDEPTSHLDMANELRAMDTVKRLLARGKTVLAVLHDLNLALRYASRLLFLKDGKIAFALEPNGVTGHVIREVYDLSVQIAMNPLLGCPVVVPLRPLDRAEPDSGSRPKLPCQ